MKVKITKQKVLTRKLVAGYYYIYNTDIPLTPNTSTCIGGYKNLKVLKDYLNRKFDNITFIMEIN